jgi:hypothetical protein
MENSDFLKYLKYKYKYLQLKYNDNNNDIEQYGGEWKNIDLFPKKNGIDYSKLKMTPEGLYSITRQKDGIVILKHMKSILKSFQDKSITDLTGNVGGDTILFGLNFKSVDSIEINPENYEALENNVKVYDLNNVKLHLGDSTKLYNWDTDVLYMDAPWGGPDYKKQKSVDLYLGDLSIDLFIKEICNRSNRPKYIFLKVPGNYKFENIFKLNKSNNIKYIKKFNIRSYNLIAIVLYKTN